ncbi:MAG: class II aldolase/adducin family protein [Thermodesulfovibrio sp.]|uniref:Class II aldolase/adducin family protein n=1 Tax=Thermodesulfovibrio obliviosus TaxID=3118332 RepID=A0AAU8H4T0_9BACT
MQWKKEREEIVKIAKRIYKKGLVTGCSGNISMRLKENLIAITAKSKSYNGLKASDVVIIDFNENVIEGDSEPSSERKLHIEIYKARKDVNAVIHTHSTFACTMAALNLSLPSILDEQTDVLGGPINVTEYAPSGTKELAEKAVKALGDKKAVFLSRHGAVSVGDSMEEAFSVCELLEKLSQIYLFMRLIQK